MKHPAVLCPPAGQVYAVMRKDLQASHPNWHIWPSDFNATKVTRHSGVTLICRNWAELTSELQAEDTAQAMKDAAKRG